MRPLRLGLEGSIGEMLHGNELESQVSDERDHAVLKQGETDASIPAFSLKHWTKTRKTRRAERVEVSLRIEEEMRVSVKGLRSIERRGALTRIGLDEGGRWSSDRRRRRDSRLF